MNFQQYYVELNKVFLKLKGPKLAKTILKKIEFGWKNHCSKIHTLIIKPVWYWCRERLTSNRTD